MSMVHPQLTSTGHGLCFGGLEQSREAFSYDPMRVPVPRWCEKGPMPTVTSEDSVNELSGQLQDTIVQLLELYLGHPNSATPSATSTCVTTTPPITPISFGNALAKDQRGLATSFDTPPIMLPPGLDMKDGTPSTSFSGSLSPSPVLSSSSTLDTYQNLNLVMPLLPGLQVEQPAANFCFSSLKTECEQKDRQSTSPSSTDSRGDPAMQQARDVATSGGGLSGFTTVMIQQVPFKYTQCMLMNEINSNGFLGTYDFLYLPVDARNPGNRGFGFINFLCPSLAEEFYQTYQGQKLANFDACRPLSVIPADTQGFEQSAQCFYKSWHLRKKKRHSEPVFLRPVPVHLKEEDQHKRRSHVR